MTSIYPKITIGLPKNPSRLYAIPVFGLLLKCLMLIPVGFELFFVGLFLYLLLILNSLYVFFTGKYLDDAYKLSLNIATLFAKTTLFLMGITDKYPGFSLKADKLISFDKPEKPNRLFAFPIFGGIVRMLILIPYFIYSSIISYAAWFGAIYAVKPVLLKEKYPELTYEIILDNTRIGLASLVYLAGLSDIYPSFKISMNHKTEKTILIILGVIWFIISNIHTNSR